MSEFDTSMKFKTIATLPQDSPLTLAIQNNIKAQDAVMALCKQAYNNGLKRAAEIVNNQDDFSEWLIEEISNRILDEVNDAKAKCTTHSKTD